MNPVAGGSRAYRWNTRSPESIFQVSGQMLQLEAPVSRVSLISEWLVGLLACL